ncbi:pyridoxamine 5'-phosphate oxidase family protein [Microbacterium gilvum]|uniref:Pyridoxal 5'-phosphate synthase n=1 Tax=Microbacterium gilvum TaxID=1336204 RepID=A0ABP9AKR4_9MICO
MSGAPGNVPPAGIGRPVQDGTAPADPLALLRDWLPADDDPARPLAVLATVDAHGAPDARTVLVSGLLAEGPTFHTDIRSRKALQLAAHPEAVLVVRWEAEARQVVVRGSAERTGRAEESVAFARRVPYLRRLARLNDDAFAALPRAQRQRRWSASAQDDPTPPATWAGYVLRPSELAFWEGAADAASRRVRYTRSDRGWSARYEAG